MNPTFDDLHQSVNALHWEGGETECWGVKLWRVFLQGLGGLALIDGSHPIEIGWRRVT
jgi:hypothetical protein